MLKPLSGYRILVTRPQIETQLLCEQLTALGADTTALPLQMRVIQPTSPPHGFYQFDGVIVVSPTAAQLAAASLSNLSMNKQAFPKLWLAIGKTTASTLQNLLHLDAITPDPENSESLLALPVLQTEQVKHQRWLLIKGQDGRTLIQDTLTDRGANICLWSLYQRITSPSYQQALENPSLCGLDSNVVIVNNAETLQLLVTLFNKHRPDIFQHIILVIPGRRLAHLANSFSFKHVVCSKGAQTEHLIVALQNDVKLKYLPE